MLNTGLTNKSGTLKITYAYPTNGTAGVVPTHDDNDQYHINYTMPSIEGYTFLCCSPGIGWTNGHGSMGEFVWMHSIQFEQSGVAGMIFKDGQAPLNDFVPQFTGVYVRNT